MRRGGTLLSLLSLLLPALVVTNAATQEGPPDPAPDPGGPSNIWYGSIPPNGQQAPVVVFVPGLNANALFFWTGGNDMYGDAYRAGFRTAFISFSADNSTANNAGIVENAAVLKTLLPVIAARYGVDRLYLVGHSKGGVDIQAALDAAIQPLVKGVFTIASPNQGTELADWAFGPGKALAAQLGLLTPAFSDLRTAAMTRFRQAVDPRLTQSGIPFYTFGGTSYAGDPKLGITGPILANLTPGVPNDGLVPLGRSRLPRGYAMDAGERANNHFVMGHGAVSFRIISGQIKSLELSQHAFVRIATDGFGDQYNTWAWSMSWYKGKLYVGTARQEYCVELATALVQYELPLYPPAQIGDCTPDYRDLRLRAEIWEYAPDVKTWKRVYQSPQDVAYTAADGSTKYQARDLGYRGMRTFTEADGTEALYVAAVSTSTLFDKDPIYATRDFPAPRLLRTIDGGTWTEVPHDPGTFMGEIVKQHPDLKVVGYRALEVYNGRLFATATDLRGQGFIIASSNPSAGNNAWERVSPDFNALPVWSLKVFNNYLYVGTGVRKVPDPAYGYGVYKTTASGSPYDYIPVIQGGAWQADPALISDAVLDMEVFGHQLYVGTNQRPELLRVNAADEWEILVGEPRATTPQGSKVPATGVGGFFENHFNIHFWQLGTDSKGRLHMVTLDQGLQLYKIPAVSDGLGHDFGFDMFRSTDGANWTLVSKNGFGDGWNNGGRSMLSTPIGFVVGTARPQGGCQIWLDTSPLDVNDDGSIDRLDVQAIRDARGLRAYAPEVRDVDGDGRITEEDARFVSMQCTRPACAIPATAVTLPPAPTNLRSVRAPLGLGAPVSLTWDASPGTAAYRVYRWTQASIFDVFGPRVASVADLTYLQEPVEVARITATSYTEPAPTAFQSLYVVRAEDATGRLSAPSNITGGPAK